MRTFRPPQQKFPRNAAERRRWSRFIRSRFIALAVISILFAGAPLIAQTPATTTAKTAAPQKTASAKKKPSAKHKKNAQKPQEAKPAVAAAPVVAPVAPPMPKWPANDRPSEASVVWDSHGLQIVAANSSLAQILHEVSTKTGATLEGFIQDQRVFGTYGPGPARDVLAHLLEGSGYNIVLIGDQGQGTPRRIVLSISGAVGAPIPAATRGINPLPHDGDDDDSDAEPPEQPEPPQMPPPPPQRQPGQNGAMQPQGPPPNNQ